MAAKFGTSGLRGLVEHITDGTCEKYVRGFLQHLLQNGIIKEGCEIYIGQDLRPSSPEIAQQTELAAQKEGFVAIQCGVVATPALAYYAMSKNAPSIMITGSHIPADRNGIKFYRPDGEIDKSDEQNISKLAGQIGVSDDVAPVINDWDDQSKTVNNFFKKRYVDVFPHDTLKGLRIGVYEHSSVARDLLKDILNTLGAEVVALGHSDTFIPVDTEAVSNDTVENLVKWTKDHKLNAIISTDGDGDRPLLSGEDGVHIKGDVIGFIASQFLKADYIVTPISSNSGIKSSDRQQVITTRVGSPFVIDGMQSALQNGGKYVVGFEANGGFLTASSIEMAGGVLKPLPTRDCVLPILAVLAAAKAANCSLVDLVKNQKLPITHSGRIQNYPTEQSRALVNSLSQSKDARDQFFADFGIITHVDQTDGLRITLENSQLIHLRPSGNAPEMRCYIEANTMETAVELEKNVVNHILSWDR